MAVVEELLLAAPGGWNRRRLLLVLDQAEELLTLTPAEERARLASLLGPALAGPVQVVATVRPEYLAPLLAVPELAELLCHAGPPAGRQMRPSFEALPAVWHPLGRRAG